VRAVIRLAAAGGMQTVAEGVETVEQRDQLRSLGCTMLQGYLLSRPAPMSGIESLCKPTIPQPRGREVIRLP